MSSVLAPTTVSPNNPITPSSVHEALSKLGISPPTAEAGYDDYTALLQGSWEVWNEVAHMDDFVPEVDEERFPRLNVRNAVGDEKENSSKAWAWRCEVKDVKPSENGLLQGKTFALKDNIALKGVPCLLGTNAIQDWKPITDATVATRILLAGGQINGKAVCENMSLWAASFSSATGHISNYWAKGYSAGGSSSGCGYVVASGEVDGAIGGDQGGSIRMPASKQGLVGLKPTFGLVPYTGIVGLEPSLDHTGPMTRDVALNAALLQAIAGYDGIDDRALPGCPSPKTVPDYVAATKAGAHGIRVGILREGFDQPTCDPRVDDLVRKAVHSFNALGMQVEEVSVPMHRAAPSLWAVIGRLSGAQTFLGRNGGRRGLALNDFTDLLLPLNQERFDHLYASTVNTLACGIWAQDHMPPSLSGKAINLVRKLRNEYDDALSRFDVLVMPTLPHLAKKLPAAEPPISPLAHMQLTAGLTLNTGAFNLSGHPALSLPIGFLDVEDDPGVRLPVGLQIVGRFHDEATIYRVAAAWENAHDWHTFA